MFRSAMAWALAALLAMTVLAGCKQQTGDANAPQSTANSTDSSGTPVQGVDTSTEEIPPPPSFKPGGGSGGK